MQKNSTIQATAEGFPEEPLAPRGPMSAAIDMTALRNMNMKELHDLRVVLHAMAEVISGFCSQPRFWRDGKNGYNGAGNAIESIAHFLNNYEQAAVNVAEAQKPIGSRDVEWRAWTLLGFEADIAGGGGLAPFAVLAAEAARDESRARFTEERSRRTLCGHEH